MIQWGQYYIFRVGFPPLSENRYHHITGVLLVVLRFLAVLLSVKFYAELGRDYFSCDYNINTCTRLPYGAGILCNNIIHSDQ